MSFHRGSSKLIILATALALVAAVASSQQPSGAVTATAQQAPVMDSLVTVEWLGEHLDDPDLVVLDCTVRVKRDEDGAVRVVSGRADYAKGHIPGAGFADLLGELSDGDSPLQFALPTPEEFCAAMGALGVGDDSRVVLYDASGSAWAARVWWMLRWVGFDRAALLDGGMAAWTAEERPLSTEATDRPAKQLTPAPRPNLIADRDEVLAATESGTVCIVDAMPEPHYRGQMAMYDRPGHIPGAVNFPVLALFDESGRFRPLDELAAMNSCDRSARAITYCGGGIAASADAFIMTRLGFTDVAVYAASLQEWAADPDLPMVVEEAP
jgi:thiosulfate/3-mercaptopyruvate sulfurtransferase